MAVPFLAPTPCHATPVAEQEPTLIRRNLGSIPSPRTSPSASSDGSQGGTPMWNGNQQGSTGKEAMIIWVVIIAIVVCTFGLILTRWLMVRRNDRASFFRPQNGLHIKWLGIHINPPGAPRPTQPSMNESGGFSNPNRLPHERERRRRGEGAFIASPPSARTRTRRNRATTGPQILSGGRRAGNPEPDWDVHPEDLEAGEGGAHHELPRYSRREVGLPKYTEVQSPYGDPIEPHSTHVIGGGEALSVAAYEAATRRDRGLPVDERDEDEEEEEQTERRSPWFDTAWGRRTAAAAGGLHSQRDNPSPTRDTAAARGSPAPTSRSRRLLSRLEAVTRSRPQSPRSVATIPLGSRETASEENHVERRQEDVPFPSTGLSSPAHGETTQQAPQPRTRTTSQWSILSHLRRSPVPLPPAESAVEADQEAKTTVEAANEMKRRSAASGKSDATAFEIDEAASGAGKVIGDDGVGKSTGT